MSQEIDKRLGPTREYIRTKSLSRALDEPAPAFAVDPGAESVGLLTSQLLLKMGDFRLAERHLRMAVGGAPPQDEAGYALVLAIEQAWGRRPTL